MVEKPFSGNIRRRILFFIPPVLVGAFFGYILLHSISVFIVYVFERRFLSALSILNEAFAIEHLYMGVYFAFIGGAIGFLFAFYRYRIMKTYSRIEEINHQLVRRNRELAQRLSEETDDPHVAQELWIILDKVHKGLDLISSGGVGTLNRRQSTLLEITQGNIDNLYLLIDRRGTPIRQIPTPRRRRTDGIDERERLNCGSNVPSIQPGQ